MTETRSRVNEDWYPLRWWVGGRRRDEYLSVGSTIFFGNGHTTLTTPEPVRSLKLSNVGPA